MKMNNFLFFKWSEIKPENVFKILAVDSAIASTRPINKGCTFSTSFKKTGMIGYAISVDKSVNRLTNPSDMMFLLSHLKFLRTLLST